MVKKRLFARIIIVLFLVTLLLPKMTTIACASSTEGVGENQVREGIVTVEGLNFRQEPDMSSKIIAELPIGTKVTILEETEEWYKAKLDYKEGYLYKEYVDILQAKGITIATTLNVRSIPTIDAQSVDKLDLGTQVFLLGVEETDDEANPIWYKILYLENKINYVSASYVNVLTNMDGTYRKTGTVTAGALNVRVDPSTENDPVYWLYKGAHVILLDSVETEGDKYTTWYKVKYLHRKEKTVQVGWVAGDYIQEDEWVEGSKGTTANSSSGSSRNDNMKLAASTLTGVIVLPGETFSWLKNMGSCSEGKGYKESTVFINKKAEKGFGGGVCQVSTTINIAIKKLDVPTNALEHSLRVGYAKRADEATVSYPNADFSFTNTLDTPILLEITTSRGNVTCKTYIAQTIEENENE